MNRAAWSPGITDSAAARFRARAVAAAVVGDDLAVELRLASAAPRAMARPVVRAPIPAASSRSR
jgi:hypothetical protein